jgi:nucleotide-binding universal stress UspA family protein
MASHLIRKILVPIDGSETSLKALSMAFSFSRLFATVSTALHVILLRPGMGEGELKGLVQESQQILSLARRVAQREGAPLEAVSIRTSSSVSEAIVDYAARNGFDLIIIGATGFASSDLGSVASGVVTRAHCPVFVVR